MLHGVFRVACRETNEGNAQENVAWLNSAF